MCELLKSLFLNFLLLTGSWNFYCNISLFICQCLTNCPHQANLPWPQYTIVLNNTSWSILISGYRSVRQFYTNYWLMQLRMKSAKTPAILSFVEQQILRLSALFSRDFHAISLAFNHLYQKYFINQIWIIYIFSIFTDIKILLS